MTGYAKKPAFLEEYVTVASRLEGFHDKYPNGRIITDLLPRDDGLISFKAYVYVDGEAKEPSATGHSIDVLDINKSSFEKLETAAVGRALAFLGFGAKNISSAEEMERHESRQQAPPLRSPVSMDQKCEQTAKAPLPGGWTIDEWRVTKAKGKILDMEAATGLPQVKCRDWLEQNCQTRAPWLCDADRLTSYGHWLVAQAEKSI